MFPSTYNNYSSSYPCYPSSSSSPSSYPPFTFLNPENNNAPSNNNTTTTTLFLHENPLHVLPYNIPSQQQHAPIIPETLTNLAVGEFMSGNYSHQYHYGSISNLIAKKPSASKKDRHSKIHTSQGLRDRRVRLSIEIARKFFDLQDMLGFDKASNTLEWLLTKSKRAIKELARTKHSNSGVVANNSFSSSSSSEGGEVDSVINNQVNEDLQHGVVDSKEKRLRRAQKKEDSNSRAKMKESREKARARARERTSNKLCNNEDDDNNNNNTSEKVQQDLKKKCPAMEEDPKILHQFEESAIRSPKLVQPQPHLVGSEIPGRDDFNVIEESIVIKRKLKQSLNMSSSSHQNLVIPKEATSFNNNSDYHSFPNLSPNWEANNNNGSNTGRSNFCTIASMNLSTRLQIFGKSWEECTNPRL